MKRNIAIVLIAAFAGLFQAIAENVTKATMQQVDIREIVPNVFGWPRELVCRGYPDGTTRCCANGRTPTLETTPGQTSWKAVCHRAPQ